MLFLKLPEIFKTEGDTLSKPSFFGIYVQVSWTTPIGGPHYEKKRLIWKSIGTQDHEHLKFRANLNISNFRHIMRLTFLTSLRSIRYQDIVHTYLHTYLLTYIHPYIHPSIHPYIQYVLLNVHSITLTTTFLVRFRRHIISRQKNKQQHFSRSLVWPTRTATVKVFQGERLMAKNNHLCLGVRFDWKKVSSVQGFCCYLLDDLGMKS